MRALVLHYDAMHTPVERLVAALSHENPIVLSIGLDAEDAPPHLAHTDARIVHVNARQMFAERFLSRAIKSNARYEGGYFLSAALSRPLIAELMAQQADSLGADTVVHGFSGNDALRVTSGLRVLAPHLRIRTAQEVCGEPVYSADDHTVSSNLWGYSVEGGALNDPSHAAPPDLWESQYPAAPERLVLDFDRGVPTGIDGEDMPLADLIAALTFVGRRFGVGRFDVVENGHVGLKTRAVYDAPAAAALVTAHEDLERFVCSRREHRVKRLADMEWSDAVYDGLWFDPVRDSLDRLIDAINERVSGRVTLELTPGGVRVVARQSPFAIYDDARAVHRAGLTFGGRLIDELAEQQSVAGRLARASVQKGARCSA